METLQQYQLSAGNHADANKGTCLLEVCSLLARKPMTDNPACVSPVIAAFGRTWNDGLGNDALAGPIGQRLLSYAPRLLNTRASAAIEERRSWLALDWLVRVQTVAWLRVAGLAEHAERLAALPELTAATLTPDVRRQIYAARDAAWDAAWSAAGTAAGTAAWSAARDAAWDAAWSAAGTAAWNAAGTAAWNAARDAAWNAARDAARDAAWNAARDAARDAAGDAAVERLAPTVAALQESAFGLLDHMIACAG